MKMAEYFKDKNVLTIDVWVMIVLLYALPQLIKVNQYQSELVPVITNTSASLIISGFVFSIIALVSIIAIFIMCGKLRNYRYFDIYVQCKKLTASKSIIYATAIGIIAILCILIGIALSFRLYTLLEIIEKTLNVEIQSISVALIITVLSLHPNNSKDIKKE